MINVETTTGSGEMAGGRPEQQIRKPRATPWLLISGAFIELLWVLTLRLTPGTLQADDPSGYTPIILASLAILLLVGQLYHRSRPGLGGRDALVIVLFAAVFAITLVSAYEPRSSADLVSHYACYARKLARQDLAAAPDTPPILLNQACDPKNSAYGPLWSVLSAGAIWTAGDDIVRQIIALKTVVIIFFGGTLGLVWLLARRTFRRTPEEAAGILLLFAWNPVILFETAQNGHNDVVMIFFLLLAIISIAGRKLVVSALALAASVLIKYATIFVMPVMLTYVWLGSDGAVRSRLNRTLRYAACFALAALPLAALFWEQGSLWRGLRDQQASWSLPHAGPLAYLIYQFRPADGSFDAPAWARGVVQPVCRAIFALALALLAWRSTKDNRTPARLVRYCLFSLVACLTLYSTWVMPWYAIWIITLFLLLDDLVGYFLISILAILAQQTGTLIPAILALIFYLPLVRLKPVLAGSRPL